MKPLVKNVVTSCMKHISRLVMTALIATSICSEKSDAKGPDIRSIGASSQQIGESGVVWYTTWKTALAEAKRSKRPIFFMSAAAQCSGISGVF